MFQGALRLHSRFGECGRMYRSCSLKVTHEWIHANAAARSEHVDRLWLGFVLLGVSLWGSTRAEAAAIHHAHKTPAVDPASYRTWSEYLMGGPTVWSSVAHPALTPAIEASMWKAIKSDPPPDTNAVVQFFMYRQSLDPPRFDHYHPRIAEALSKIEAELATTRRRRRRRRRHRPRLRLPNKLNELTPAAVPEPATLFLTIGMAGYALWWRRRRI